MIRSSHSVLSCNKYSVHINPVTHLSENANVSIGNYFEMQIWPARGQCEVWGAKKKKVKESPSAFTEEMCHDGSLLQRLAGCLIDRLKGL